MGDERLVHAPFEIARLCQHLRGLSCGREEPERNSHMTTRRILVASAVLALITAPAFAQGMEPSKPAQATPPAAAAPVKPVTTTGAANNPVAAKTNLNTATAAELDK